jgi:DNA polymerase I
MTFTIDYRDGDVYRWTAGADGATYERDGEYAPAFYVSAPSPEQLRGIEGHLSGHPRVADSGVEEWRTVWRNDPEPVLRLEARSLEAVPDVAHEVRGWGTPGEYRLYNVDFDREFRYCLENDVDPTPADGAELATLELALPAKALNDGDVEPLELDGEPAGATEPEALDGAMAALSTRDPDVLVVSSSDLVPLLYRKAERYDRADFELGRLPGWRRLAGESTVESYGQVGHSPARYNVPGRAIVDVSNSFFWRRTNLDGILDLVERSRKPIQEAAWASIGNVLTAIQICEAHKRGVLVPWHSWRHEKYKSIGVLHDADRGGFIFAPEVGLHEEVHELDFSSLYPNIICTRNVSPDVIRCECHRDREDVPGTRLFDLRQAGLPRRRPPADHRCSRRDQSRHPSRTAA